MLTNSYASQKLLIIALRKLGQQGIPIETDLAVAFINGILIFTIFIGVLAFAFGALNHFRFEF